MQHDSPTSFLHAQHMLPTLEATAQLASIFASKAQRLDNICIFLVGGLGAGKTTFVRYLLRALGVQGRIKSPTYALLESYELEQVPCMVHHFDLYRLEQPQEWMESGLQDIVYGEGLKLIEWPQKAPELHDFADLQLHFSPLYTTENEAESNAGVRKLEIFACSQAGHLLVEHVLNTL